MNRQRCRQVIGNYIGVDQILLHSLRICLICLSRLCPCSLDIIPLYLSESLAFAEVALSFSTFIKCNSSNSCKSRMALGLVTCMSTVLSKS